jgi:hypothetical protein
VGNPTFAVSKPVRWYRALYARATIASVYVIWTLAIGLKVKGMSPEDASLYFNEPYDLESVNDAALGYFIISGVLAAVTVGVIALVRYRRRVYACRWP